MYRFLTFLLLCVSLYAEEQPKPTVEQLQAQLVQKEREIRVLGAKLAIYQRIAFACQDAQVDAQAQAAQGEKNPEGKK